MNWKLRLRRRRVVALAVSACVLVVAAPTAVAATWEDLRSPDTRDAALAAEKESQSGADEEIYVNPSTGLASGAGPASQDLRSPDARDAALASQQAAQPSAAYRAGYSDLRSPDARDAARGITTGSVSAPAPLAVERRTVVTVDDSSSQTLAIVFSACALLIALMSVGFVALARRPRPRWTAS